jgi:hypothetical protein
MQSSSRSIPAAVRLRDEPVRAKGQVRASLQALRPLRTRAQREGVLVHAVPAVGGAQARELAWFEAQAVMATAAASAGRGALASCLPLIDAPVVIPSADEANKVKATRPGNRPRKGVERRIHMTGTVGPCAESR